MKFADLDADIPSINRRDASSVPAELAPEPRGEFTIWLHEFSN